MRARREMAPLPDDPPAPAGPAPGEDERLAAVRRAVGELHENYRQVVVLRFMLQMPYREIAYALGTTTGQVGSLLARANQLLKRKLCRFFLPGGRE